MTKSVAEIIASKDVEAAFLFLISDHDGQPMEIPSGHELEALVQLATPWLRETDEGDSCGPVFAKITTDEGRKIFLLHLTQDGFGGLIALFGEAEAAAHRPLILEYFLECCDDPGYFDEMLESNAATLSATEKVKLLEVKLSLG